MTIRDDVTIRDGVTIRPAVPEDAAELGRICYEAFAAIADAHRFPRDFPSPEVAAGLMSSMLGRSGFFGVVAESKGRLVGSNFLDERSAIAGVGPITVDPAAQDGSVGRALMEAVLARAEERQAPGVRLVQVAYHNRSFALYAKLGFAVREPLACLQGRPPRLELPGYGVRPATEADREACDALCRELHGKDRSGELADAIAAGSALAVERGGELRGYSTGLAFFAHSVARENEALEALICSATELGGPGILVPARNAELLGFCLAHGLRVVQLMTLMTRGWYREPAGAYLCSIKY